MEVTPRAATDEEQQRIEDVQSVARRQPSWTETAPKQHQGDSRTPEGTYTISGRNPQSRFHFSLRISYPTPEQSANAKKLGLSAGGDIFIHGLPNGYGRIGKAHLLRDWTDGCIAVTDEEIDEIARAVPNGTVVEIHP